MIPRSNRVGADAVARGQVALTARQSEVLEYILAYCAGNGYAPSRLDMCDYFGFKSPNAAEEHLRTLARKGYIAVDPGIARGIRVLVRWDIGASTSNTEGG